MHQSVCGEQSDEFKTIIGVLPGCLLSPLIFNIVLELIVTATLESEEIGMQIGGVRKGDLCFSCDTALLAESPNELQASINRVVEVSEKPWYENKHQGD